VVLELQAGQGMLGRERFGLRRLSGSGDEEGGRKRAYRNPGKTSFRHVVSPAGSVIPQTTPPILPHHIAIGHHGAAQGLGIAMPKIGRLT
jgi:hypothetical protein